MLPVIIPCLFNVPVFECMVLVTFERVLEKNFICSARKKKKRNWRLYIYIYTYMCMYVIVLFL